MNGATEATNVYEGA